MIVKDQPGDEPGGDQNGGGGNDQLMIVPPTGSYRAA